jgi:hypothetical protein
MSRADEYCQFANDCIVWARIATSGDQREQFLVIEIGRATAGFCVPSVSLPRFRDGRC